LTAPTLPVPFSDAPFRKAALIFTNFYFPLPQKASPSLATPLLFRNPSCAGNRQGSFNFTIAVAAFPPSSEPQHALPFVSLNNNQKEVVIWEEQSIAMGIRMP
jgi:hypothetical protein